jgi:hypothetical protein
MRAAPWLLIALIATALTVPTAAQFQGRRGGRGFQPPPNPPYDGAYTFCRIMFRNSSNGDGGGWSVDYPRADENFPFRLSELTLTPVSRGVGGTFNHAVFRLTDRELFKCPFVMLTEPGGAYFDEDEAAALRTYLAKGGFLWADDFWGEYAWSIWQSEIAKALPEYQIIDLPLSHPLFHMLYQVTKVPQIPSIHSWFGRGGSTSERGADSAVPHARAILDERGNVMVLITHNTDFGDAFEREGENRAYFEEFAGVGYAFGINALLYAMSH